MRRIAGILTAFLIGTSNPAFAGRVENVLLSRNQVLFVRAEFDTPVIIRFPHPIAYVVPADSRINVQAGNDFVILKVIDSSLKNGILSVVLDREGKPFVVPVQVQVVNGTAPLKVVVKDKSELVEKLEKQSREAFQESAKEARSTPVADLIAGMARNTEFPREWKPIPGYTLIDHKGKVLKSFSQNNLLEARLLYEYRSPVRTGVVIKLVNKSIYPLRISEKDFVTDGILAVSLSRERLAPRPYTATEKLAGDYTAYLYLVIRGDKWQK